MRYAIKIALVSLMLAGAWCALPILKSDIGANVLSWYAFNPQIYLSAKKMLSAFTGIVVIIALLFSLLSVFIILLRTIKIEHQENLFFSFIIRIGLVCSGVIFLIGSLILKENHFTQIISSVLFFVTIAVSAHAYYRNSALGAFLRRQTVDVMLAFGIPPISANEDPDVAFKTTRYIYNPNRPLWLKLAYFMPICLAFSGLAVGALFIQFLWPAIGLVTSNAIQNLSSSTSSPAPLSAAQNFIFIIAALAVLILQTGLLAYMRSGSRPLVFRLFARLLAVTAILSTCVMIGYAIYADPFLQQTLVSGIGYLFLALSFASTCMIWIWYRLDSITPRFMSLIHSLRLKKFWKETAWIYNQFPQPKNPKGYVFFNTLTDVYGIACLLLVLCRLRLMGYAVILMDQWPIRTEKLGRQEIDRFSGISLGSQMMLNFDWQIDWKNKKVEAAGFNFYHPIWEGMSRHYGRYFISQEEFERDDVQEIFRSLLAVADASLMTCIRIFNTVATQGKPVRILGTSAQFVPNAVFNIFCRELGKKQNMHFVWLQQGYQTYYNDKGELSKFISLENMTAKWPYSNPYLPYKEDFEAWIAKGQDVESITKEAISWAQTNRANASNKFSESAQEALGRIRAHRAKGGRVVCVFGKMVFDLSTPWERGPAHTGMDDWLNHTVDTVRGHDHVLLVIKPHPYEARPEIAGIVEQYFTDMIEKPLPENVMILGHNWINLHAMMGDIDLGILWNGTSGLEMGLQNIPVILGSDWGPIDYPVGFAHPKDRKDYENMILNADAVKMPSDYREKCALLLKYTQHEEVMIPYDYAARPLTNKPFGPPWWYMDQVRNFIKNGDPHIDRAARKVIYPATE